MNPTKEEIAEMTRQIRSEWTVSQRRSSIADYQVAFHTDLADASAGMENAIHMLHINSDYYGPMAAESEECHIDEIDEINIDNTWL